MGCLNPYANKWKSKFGAFFQCVYQQLKVEIWYLFSICLPKIESRNLVPFFNVSASNWKSKLGTFFQHVCQQLKVEIWYLFSICLPTIESRNLVPFFNVSANNWKSKEIRKADNCRLTPPLSERLEQARMTYLQYINWQKGWKTLMFPKRNILIKVIKTFRYLRNTVEPRYFELG